MKLVLATAVADLVSRCADGDRLTRHFVYATAAVVAACQAPTASDQGALRNERPHLIGRSDSPSSQYELDSFGPLQPPNFPGFHGGSNRGP